MGKPSKTTSVQIIEAAKLYGEKDPKSLVSIELVATLLSLLELVQPSSPEGKKTPPKPPGEPEGDKKKKKEKKTVDIPITPTPPKEDKKDDKKDKKASGSRKGKKKSGILSSFYSSSSEEDEKEEVSSSEKKKNPPKKEPEQQNNSSEEEGKKKKNKLAKRSLIAADREWYHSYPSYDNWKKSDQLWMVSLGDYDALGNVSQSCYMDSLLFILMELFPSFMQSSFYRFADIPDDKNPFSLAYCGPASRVIKHGKVTEEPVDTVQKDWLARKEIAKGLRVIAKGLDDLAQGRQETEATCINFKKMLAGCTNGVNTKFYQNSMEDSAEFYRYLCGAFEVTPIVTSTVVETFKSGGKVRDNVLGAAKKNDNESLLRVLRDDEFISVFLPSEHIYQNTETIIEVVGHKIVEENGEEVLSGNDRKADRRMVESVNAEFVPIDMARLIPSGTPTYINQDEMVQLGTGKRSEILVPLTGDGAVFDTRRCMFEEFIYLNGQAFQFAASIMFANRHYTAYIKDQGVWYQFDDNQSPKIKKLNIKRGKWGGFDKLEPTSVMNRMTRQNAMMFYRKIEPNHMPMACYKDPSSRFTPMIFSEGFYWRPYFDQGGNLDESIDGTDILVYPSLPSPYVFENRESKEKFRKLLKKVEGRATKDGPIFIKKSDEKRKCAICWSEGRSTEHSSFLYIKSEQEEIKWALLGHMADKHNSKPSDHFIEQLRLMEERE